MAKFKVVADVVPDADYLTSGKEYDAEGNVDGGAEIADDFGHYCFIYIPDCSHLNGRAWRVVKVYA
jgi:hypothetical protein